MEEESAFTKVLNEEKSRLSKDQSILSHTPENLQHKAEAQANRPRIKKRLIAILGISITATVTWQVLQNYLVKNEAQIINEVQRIEQVESESEKKKIIDQAVKDLQRQESVLKLVGLDSVSLSEHQVEKDLARIKINNSGKEKIKFKRPSKNYEEIMKSEIFPMYSHAPDTAHRMFDALFDDIDGKGIAKEWHTLLFFHSAAEILNHNAGVRLIEDYVHAHEKKIINKARSSVKKTVREHMQAITTNPHLDSALYHFDGLPVVILKFPVDTAKRDWQLASTTKAKQLCESKIHQGVDSRHAPIIITDFRHENERIVVVGVPVLNKSVIGSSSALHGGVSLP